MRDFGHIGIVPGGYTWQASRVRTWQSSENAADAIRIVETGSSIYASCPIMAEE